MKERARGRESVGKVTTIIFLSIYYFTAEETAKGNKAKNPRDAFLTKTNNKLQPPKKVNIG